MTAVSAFCGIVILMIAASWLRKGADPLSPGRVFGIIWALSIGLADLKLSVFQHEWTFYGWSIILLGVGAFLVGVFIPHVYFLSTPLLSISEVRTRLQDAARRTVDPDRLYWTILVLFGAYLLAYLAEVALEGTVPLFAPNPERLRVRFGFFGLHLVVTSMLTILIFVVEYMLFMPRDRAKRAVVMGVFIVTSATFLLLLQRYSFAFWGLLALGLTYYGSQKIRLRTVLIAGAIMGAIFVAIQNVRTALYVEQYLYAISKMKFSREYAVFTEPYMYFVMNLENVARSVERLDHFYYGYFTFDWIVALTGLKHWIGEYFAIDRLPFMNSAYNTYAFQWWAYYDFGSVGVALIALALGLMVGFSYHALRTRPNVWTAYLYAIGLTFMVTSFRENMFTRLDAVSNLALMWFVHRFIVGREPDSPAAEAQRQRSA